jgi:hypothetical protein
VEIKTQVRDPSAVAAACRRLGLPEPKQNCFRLFSSEAKGLGVELPGWSYPVVIDTLDGSLRFDNYNGAWGNPSELDKFLQAFALEKASIEARKQGHSVSEQLLADGSIKLTIHVGGMA